MSVCDTYLSRASHGGSLKGEVIGWELLPQRATWPPLFSTLITDVHKLPKSPTNRSTISTSNQHFG